LGEGGAISIATGVTTVVILIRMKAPAFVSLAMYVGFTGLTLSIQ
jgi:hypothetical protein